MTQANQAYSVPLLRCLTLELSGHHMKTVYLRVESEERKSDSQRQIRNSDNSNV